MHWKEFLREVQAGQSHKVSMELEHLARGTASSSRPSTRALLSHRPYLQPLYTVSF